MVLASNKIIFLSLEIIFSQDKLVFYSFFSVLYCIVNLFFKIFTAKKFGDYNKRGQVIELISIGLPLLYAAYALFLPFDKGFLWIHFAFVEFSAPFKTPPWLCCTNPVRDSLRETSMIAGRHEQLGTHEIQDHELVVIQW
jgi:hypothetical protein